MTQQEKPGTPTKDLETAVVWLTPVNGGAPRPAPQKAQIGMRSRTFTPHVQVVPVYCNIHAKMTARVVSVPA